MKGRFFVDLAANHAWHISNTYALEQRLSWKGICIEPQPRYHWKLAMRNCTVYAAVITSTPDVEVYVVCRRHRQTSSGEMCGVAGVILC